MKLVELLLLFCLSVSLWLLNGNTVLEYYTWNKLVLYTICIIGLIDSLITSLGFFALNGN